jgi:large subunit ribosomal protein L1
VEFRVDKTSIIHAPVGKASFGREQLVDNAQALFTAILRARPAAAKGRYIRAASLSTTMGPGIRLDESTLTGPEA